MRNLYEHHFTLKPGTRVYVPTAEGRSRGETVKTAIQKLWKPPDNYYHLKAGGHVGAVRQHFKADWLASLDLKRFFDQITRTKVHRTLKALGVEHADAWEMACDSSVDKRPPKRHFSIPFGFVQSPILASAVLARSALGGAIRSIQNQGLTITVYVDDLIVSGQSEKIIQGAVAALEAGAHVAGFSFNPDKTQPPSNKVISFNIEFGAGKMEVIDSRMAEFEVAIRDGNQNVIDGVLAYLGSVNRPQCENLSQDVFG